jgi:hypothetical protein
MTARRALAACGDENPNLSVSRGKFSISNRRYHEHQPTAVEVAVKRNASVTRRDVVLRGRRKHSARREDKDASRQNMVNSILTPVAT